MANADIEDEYARFNIINVNELSSFSYPNDRKSSVMTPSIEPKSTPPIIKPGTGFRPSTNYKPPGTGISYKPGTALKLNAVARPGTGNRPNTELRSSAGIRPGSGFRPITREEIKRPITGYGDGMNRPMTAVRGAGYTSHGRKSGEFKNTTNEELSGPAESPTDEAPETKIKAIENAIMKLIETSIIANSSGNKQKSLSLAKEASTKERSLLRLQEQAGLGDSQNMDLTYMVLFNLANQYTSNELYTEAIKTYQLLVKNRMFPNANRIKINMGIVYYKLGHFPKAVKFFKMAMDQIPTTHNELRIKIMHNIGILLVKVAKYEEACVNFEYIMTEQPSFQTGFHLLLCYYALGDKDKMKRALTMILDIQLDIDEEEKFITGQINNIDQDPVHKVIQDDRLSKYEAKMRTDAENIILMAVKLIAPVIEENISTGYEWCIEAVKVSNYSELAGNLEINKAIMFLKNRDLQQAIETLKGFEKQENKIAGAAATNLSFIYFLQNDLTNAERYAQLAIESHDYKGYGLVNVGCVELVKGNKDKAKEYFLHASEIDQSSVEAFYNLGLLHKQNSELDEAQECFSQVNTNVPMSPWVQYQAGQVLQLQNDLDAAAVLYNEALSACPAAPGLLTALAEIQEKLHETQLAYNYYSEAFRFYPSDFNVINWLGSYYIDLHVAEKALYYFEKAALLQPGEPKWRLLVANCYRQTGNLQKALKIYEDVHNNFPDNEDSLRYLIRICTDLGLKEAAEYSLELKKLEKNKEVRERISSSRPSTSRPGTTTSRRSGSGLSSRGGSGQSNDRSSPQQINKTSKQLPRISSLMEDQVLKSEIFSQLSIDASYSDPLGPMELRPRTSAGKPLDEDFGDEELGDDLLPE